MFYTLLSFVMSHAISDVTHNTRVHGSAAPELFSPIFIIILQYLLKACYVDHIGLVFLTTKSPAFLLQIH